MLRNNPSGSKRLLSNPSWWLVIAILALCILKNIPTSYHILNKLFCGKHFKNKHEQDGIGMFAIYNNYRFYLRSHLTGLLQVPFSVHLRTPSILLKL